MFSIEARNFARGFALDGTFFQVCAFITRDFSVSDAELGFQLPILPVKLKDYQGATFDLTFAIKLIDFLSMQQKFTDTFCRWDFMTRLFVGLNVGVVEKRLPVFNTGKSVADIGFAGAGRGLPATYICRSYIKVAASRTNGSAVLGAIRRYRAHRDGIEYIRFATDTTPLFQGERRREGHPI